MKIIHTVIVGLVLFGTLTACNKQHENNITILHFSQLIDGTGEVLIGHEIAVEDGLIVAIGDSLINRFPAAIIIDNSQLVALPGLIDAHVHITYALPNPPKKDAWAELDKASPADWLMGAEQKARQSLESGVTTVRDLGSWKGTGFALRDKIEQGEVEGPRIFLSSAPVWGSGDQDIVVEYSQMARERIAEGADWIKIFASTGGASDLTGTQTVFYPEIKAVVDIAHANGIRVALHTYGANAVPDALRAGVDSIEHPVNLTAEILNEWAATNIIYIPTVDHNRYYADHRAEYGYDETIEGNLREFVQANVETVRRAHTAGIKIAMGSDAVFTMFGQNTRELEWFVEAGMSPTEAIQTATVNGAVLLGQENFLGRLAPGFAADIIAVNGKPLFDIRAVTRNIVWVMKDGEVVVDNKAKND